LFAVGVTQQALPNGTRAVCADADDEDCLTLDVDFVNCVIAVLVYLADQNDLGNRAPLLKDIKDDHKKYRKFLSGLYDIPEKESKKLLYKSVFGGRPYDSNPLLWALSTEALDLAMQLLALPQASELLFKYANRPNPTASRLAVLCFQQEATFLAHLVDHIKAQNHEINISVLMFDGVVVNMRDTASKEQFNQILDSFNAVSAIQAAVKGWS
jgi:hypothetical protein